MGSEHETRDVYRLPVGYVTWVHEKADAMNGFHRAARHQRLGASQSILLNIAEGNGTTADADQRRSLEIAGGSALECVAIQDVLVVSDTFCKVINELKEREKESPSGIDGD